MDGQIRLRWTSHQGTILSVFDALLASESLVDVTLACEGQYIRAHKVILSACSPYFQELINVDVGKHPIFFLKDVKYFELKALVQYMYRGEVNIPHEQLPSLLAVAQSLQIRGLADVETANNSISSDTIILPQHSTGSGRTKPPPLSTAPPQVTIPPPQPQSTSTAQPPRAFSQEPTFNPVTNNVVLPAGPAVAVPSATTLVPLPPKRSRIETRNSSTPSVPKKTEVDPLLDVQSHPAVSQLLEPLKVSQPSGTSSANITSIHGRVREKDFGGGTVENSELYGSAGVKLEATGAIEVDLEDEEENSMSQSSFPDAHVWQVEGDNSMLDGEIPGGSYGGADGGSGAEGGDGRVQCEDCGKWLGAKSRSHFLYDCLAIPPKFPCEMCPFAARRESRLRIHVHTAHSRKIQKEN